MGRCPPENSGGIGGYLDQLDAYADPTHEYRDDAVEWLGDGFDPMHVDTVVIERRLTLIANRIAKRQSKPATRSRKVQRAAAG